MNTVHLRKGDVKFGLNGFSGIQGGIFVQFADHVHHKFVSAHRLCPSCSLRRKSDSNDRGTFSNLSTNTDTYIYTYTYIYIFILLNIYSILLCLNSGIFNEPQILSEDFNYNYREKVDINSGKINKQCNT